MFKQSQRQPGRFPAPVGAVSSTCGEASRAVSSSGTTAATGNDVTNSSRGLTFFALHCSIALIHNRVSIMSEPKGCSLRLNCLAQSGSSCPLASGAVPRSRRPVAAENLHLTLAFLGDVSAEKQQALSQLAGRIRQPGFTLKLDDAGQWLRSRVVWLGMRQPPRGLLQLANMLRAQAARSGVIKARSRFTHISRCCAMPDTRFPSPTGLWLVISGHEFALYSSSFARGRTRYTQLQRWTLTE
jgi:2'-5' RNA ligase